MMTSLSWRNVPSWHTMWKGICVWFLIRFVFISNPHHSLNTYMLYNIHRHTSTIILYTDSMKPCQHHFSKFRSEILWRCQESISHRWTIDAIKMGMTGFVWVNVIKICSERHQHNVNIIRALCLVMPCMSFQFSVLRCSVPSIQY